MNEREDYLDRLLRGVEDDPEDREQGREDDLFGEDDAFSEDGEDDFLKAFEDSMSRKKERKARAAGGDEPEPEPDEDMDFDMDFDMDDIDDIVSNVKNGTIGRDSDLPMDEPTGRDSSGAGTDGAGSGFAPPEDDQDYMVNTMDDEDIPAGQGAPEQDFDGFSAGSGEDDSDLDDMARNLAQEIDDLGLDNDEEEPYFGVDDGLAPGNEGNPMAGDAEGDEDEGEEGRKGNRKKKKKKKKDKGEKPGLFRRFANAMFGEDEPDGSLPEMGELENISDENMEILREMEEKEKAEKDEKKAKKAQKKKEKQEKKEQKKQEKEAKKAEKAQAKANKPKKEKKPKEPQPYVKTKPLPKGPVLMIALIGASLVILINLASKQVGYTSSVSEAEAYYEKGDYVSAYSALPAEEEVKEPDMELYQKARVTAYLQRPIDSYRAYQKHGMYAEALSSLIVGVGRYDKNEHDASMAGSAVEYDKMLKTIQKALKKNYKMTLDEARKLYDIREREEYTYAVNDVIDKLGLSAEEEE